MSTDLSAETKAAITGIIAKQILAAVGTEARDELLRASITNVLTEYSFKNAIEKAVANEGSRVAAELLKSAEFQAAILEAVKSGCDEFVAKLRDCMYDSLVEMFIGKSGDRTYDRDAGLLYKKLARTP